MTTKMANEQDGYLDKERKKLKELVNSIILGSDDTEKLLKWFKNQRKGKEMLKNYRVDDETLLHLATKFYKDADVVKSLISLCPTLLTVTKGGKYEGQTALHIAISKENCKAVEAMVTHTEKRHLLTIPATGSRFRNTVMMGELPLSVAAATCNNNIVLQLINAGAKMNARNSYGDTVFHTLVKFSCLHPDKLENFISIMKTLNGKLAKRSCEKIEEIKDFYFKETDPVAIWFLPNYEHLTPLQLASKLGQMEIFNFILNLEDVYCRLQDDGLFDIKKYDITEIDPVAMRKCISSNRETKRSKIVPQNTNTDLVLEDVNTNQTRFNRLPDPRDYQSVLDRISKTEVEKAFQFLLLPVIRCIIKDKWSLYRWYYYAWAIFHLVHMSTMAWYAIERTRLLNIKSSQNSTSAMNFETLVNLFTFFNIMMPILYVLFECRRRLLQKQFFHLTNVHHNGTYRVLLILFSLTAFIDAIWYKIQPGSNYFLIFSVLTGCWFLTFFLRAFKTFSFFTVMIHKIIFSDLIRFSVIIGLELVSFTAMIYLLFVNSQPPVDEFGSYQKSLLTLFNLLLGLSDIKVFNQADDPWLAVILFTIFALLTYVLMINALIAMMSQTCALVSSNKRMQWQLQRLSIILFIENTVFPFMRKCSGQKKYVRHFDMDHKTMINEKRYFLELDYLQTSYSKAEAILGRRDQTKSKYLKDTLLSVTSTVQSTGPLEEVKFAMTKVTQSADPVIGANRWEKTPTEFSTDLQERDERGETPEIPQVDISKVYI
ncbi:transient receptor potential cation channel subfamily V member 5-like [Gigantopelta aegis]|uniref:transient receptor potential cation channel subfamily V member 5-like n=1 Tax=Gigantopelta aegis TaxID=1735272 RepID=UPI001B88C7CB|nr:transient receptor potential cation channel subfamily V member 5-like [Gigantopelta aegis]